MRVVGLIILLIGLVVFGFGVSSSQAITEHVIEGVSGRETSITMWYIITGISLCVVGSALALYGKDK